MPTDEYPPLLDRVGAKAQAAPLIDIASPLLREIVNHSTWAFKRCALESSDREGEDVAAFVLYRQAIELADGIEVLLAEACATAAIPTLRALFETVMGLQYLHESDATYVDRSFAWLYCYTRERIDIRLKLDPAVPRTQRLFEDWHGDGESLSLPPELVEASRRIVRGLQDVLAGEDYGKADTEYKRIATDWWKPKWYSFYGGPRTLLDLARHLGQEREYEILYRSWSRLAHAADASRFLGPAPSGAVPPFTGVRTTNGFINVAQIPSSLMLEATRLMLGKFRSGENVKNWYLQEIQPRYEALERLSSRERAAVTEGP